MEEDLLECVCLNVKTAILIVNCRCVIYKGRPFNFFLSFFKKAPLFLLTGFVYCVEFSLRLFIMKLYMESACVFGGATVLSRVAEKNNTYPVVSYVPVQPCN